LEIMPLSCSTGEWLENWLRWLEGHAAGTGG
jgi:hypothetical protein